MKDGRPAPTLHDVAKLSGVSTATVSRCLNFPKQVSEKTREKVDEAIETLGYSPNFGARAMAAQRTNTIGAIIPTMENAIFARGIQAFQEELAAHGYNLMVASSSYRADLEAQQIRSLVARGADGLLLIGHWRDSGLYDFLAAQKVPALVTWTYDSAAPRASIGFDNHGAMKELAEKVFALGHRRVAMISADSTSNDRAAARVAGFREAAQEAGVTDGDLTVIETVYGIESGATAFADLMLRPAPPTAVFCGNDVLAVGALGCARELGLQVPDDVSIVGFDDIELAQVAFPKLTTVHVPHREMGRRAARALVQALQDGTPIEPLQLPTSVVLRDSLGPVPNTAT